MRWILSVLLLLALIAGGAWWMAGRAAGPAIAIAQPLKVIGESSEVALSIDAPGGRLSTLEIVVEQGGRSLPVFALTPPELRGAQARRAGSRVGGKPRRPERTAGSEGRARTYRRACVAARAVWPAPGGVRAARDVQVRLEPPRANVLSPSTTSTTGGAEFVVYRGTPNDVESGVRVGDDVAYPGFPVRRRHQGRRRRARRVLSRCCPSSLRTCR